MRSGGGSRRGFAENRSGGSRPFDVHLRGRMRDRVALGPCECGGVLQFKTGPYGQSQMVCTSCRQLKPFTPPIPNDK